MKSDSQIREEVIQELRWDPQVTDPDAIGVAVKDGAVTLTGTSASPSPTTPRVSTGTSTH